MLRLNNSIIHNSLEVNTNNKSWKEPRMKSFNSHWRLTGSSAAVAKASKQADVDINTVNQNISQQKLIINDWSIVSHLSSKKNNNVLLPLCITLISLEE